MYEHIARYYDLSHDHLVEDIPFLLKLAAETTGPVLEIGCGSGRLLVPLARAGYAVTGVDSSPEMLAQAEIRLAAQSSEVRARVQLVAGDVKSLRLPPGEFYGLIVFGYNTFMHLDEAAAGAVLKRLRPALGDGGRLVIDVANPILLSSAADDPDFVLEDVLEDRLHGKTIRQYTAYEAIPGEQAVDVTWIYETTGDALDDDEGALKTRLRYHYLYPHQYDLLLTLTGFRLASLSGDYDGSPFHEESDRLILLAAA
ncbi:MAG: class I SAM-dependent methyltransferase [Anaerolineae bacterium]|uniref:class I SAM-dependent methyltransferase n=1 Tax=Promineifilum sp. TaxID=2664178 RepID=UPI001D6EA480|nr:class I SAM-dependent methyltransferase [Anaerolineales bacterium]MCB8935888.1 class I SAM-dependent methyltransferase [Promineifilum sp.]MCO5180711.1 class I SAM-dependent methyltransferase [Promineifilum sp.]MCW5847836.1 class I SAM-dependent methyltransferase [Anaerolineae bacterium]